MPCSAWKCVLAAISSGVGYPNVLGCICYDRSVLCEDHKNEFKDPCFMNSQPTFLIFVSFLTQKMAILSKARKPGILIYTTLKNLVLPIFEFLSDFVGCESFFESNSPDILRLCETNLDDSIDSNNFSGRDYVPLNRKNFVNSNA